MFTSLDDEKYGGQHLSLNLDPCKGPGQGFGSATGQYLDICIKFDTRTLSGYGIRFVRTPHHDKAVEIYLVAYNKGVITPISSPEKCTLFRRGCHIDMLATHDSLTVTVTNPVQKSASATQSLTSQTLKAPISHNSFGGIHIQHTGSTGASATVISNLHCDYRD